MYRLLTLFIIAMTLSFAAKAQRIDSIYIHLYTDSLKKGTYNYINIDGLMSNGKYLPLDSTQLSFTCSYGKFFGNSLWIEPACKEEKINIQVVCKKNPALKKDFVMYIKKKEDGPLKTQEEIMREIKSGKKGR